MHGGKKKIKLLPPAQGYDLMAPVYDRKESYLDSFEQGRLLALMGSVRGLSILDAGAGTGRLAVKLVRGGARVVAADFSTRMLKVLKKKDGALFAVAGDAERLPVQNNSFDWVLGAFLLVHLSDPSLFFEQAYAALKDGGRLLITNINQKEPPAVATQSGIIKVASCYHRPDRIREMLERLAFQIELDEFIKENGIWINQMLVARK